MARKKKNELLDKLKAEAILWRDRKRILGMPISFTVYEVTSERLITRIGFFSTETNELLLYRILDVKMVRTLWQKIFGVGTITVYSADQSSHTLPLRNIKHPDKVRRLLSEMVEAERTEKGMRGREIYGVAGELGHDGHNGDLNGDGIPDVLQ